MANEENTNQEEYSKVEDVEDLINTYSLYKEERIPTLETLEEVYNKINIMDSCQTYSEHFKSGRKTYGSADFNKSLEIKLGTSEWKDYISTGYKEAPLYVIVSPLVLENKPIKDEDLGTLVYEDKSIEVSEEDHTGQIYNPITDTWSWL